jgi:hypothetical protein
MRNSIVVSQAWRVDTLQVSILCSCERSMHGSWWYQNYPIGTVTVTANVLTPLERPLSSSPLANRKATLYHLTSTHFCSSECFNGRQGLFSFPKIKCFIKQTS